jgi:hypothetical protein
MLQFLQIMQGLLDQHVAAGNGKALGMVVAMADYFAGRQERHPEVQHQAPLDVAQRRALHHHGTAFLSVFAVHFIHSFPESLSVCVVAAKC